jgi:hypothetical protein
MAPQNSPGGSDPFVCIAIPSPVAAAIIATSPTITRVKNKGIVVAQEVVERSQSQGRNSRNDSSPLDGK